MATDFSNILTSDIDRLSRPDIQFWWKRQCIHGLALARRRDLVPEALMRFYEASRAEIEAGKSNSPYLNNELLRRHGVDPAVKGKKRKRALAKARAAVNAGLIAAPEAA